MFSRIIPSWEQIEQFKQPLTEGEIHLLKFLDNNLKRDFTFQSGDLTKYNGWLIFVQPFLNGSRPDVVILNPYVGVQVFEVKDWNLSLYSFEFQEKTDRNRKVFYVRGREGKHPIRSPIKQVEYYKAKIASQLMPQIGESFDENSQQYGLIKTAVYFHKSTTEQAQKLFKSQVPNFLKFPIIGYDALKQDNLDEIIPDGRRKYSIYWQRDWNKELLFWLNPPVHTIEQGIPLTLTHDQKKFAEPQSGHYRVRGVAGSGKTQVLAYRASKLASQGYRVLILTFNITLWHLIHDMVQRSPFTFCWNKLTITYFHGFCKDIFNEFDEEWPKIDDDENLFRQVIPNKVLEIVNREKCEEYDVILIDEGQDFYVEWYNMLCRFLTNRDELVVVCDKKQNVYGREMEWLDKRRRGVEKFGDWIELKKIIRLPERVAKISVEFSERFNLNRDVKVGNIEKPDLFNQFQDHVIWWNIERDWLEQVDRAFEVIKEQATHNHPSDTVILLPDRYFGLKCVKHFELKKNILVNHVFEEDKDKKFHRYKKVFWMGDSRLKMSTIQSFKGWEAPNVIIVIPPHIPGDAQIYDNIVYTAITRSRENLIIINTNRRYQAFGENISSTWI